MKIRTAMLLSMGLIAGCANQVEPVTIEMFYQLGTDGTNQQSCLAIEKPVRATAGSLDVAAGSPQFILAVRLAISKEYGAQGLALKTGEVLEAAKRNRPVITQQVITYRLSKRLGAAPKPFITNRTLQFTSDLQSFDMPIQFISPEFGAQLFDGLTASKTLDDSVDIQADVEFKGELSATKTPFDTGIVTFPIRAFRSQPDPCAGTGEYRRFPFAVDSMSGTAVDECRYVGQQVGVIFLPAPPNPADCCVPGSVGC